MFLLAGMGAAGVVMADTTLGLALGLLSLSIGVGGVSVRLLSNVETVTEQTLSAKSARILPVPGPALTEGEHLV